MMFQNSTQTNHQTDENKRDERKKKKKKRETSEEQNGEKQTRKKRKREENGQNTDRKQKKRKQEAFDGKHRISTVRLSSCDLLITSCVFDQSESLNPEGEEPETQESGSNSTGISP